MTVHVPMWFAWVAAVCLPLYSLGALVSAALDLRAWYWEHRLRKRNEQLRTELHRKLGA